MGPEFRHRPGGPRRSFGSRSASAHPIFCKKPPLDKAFLRRTPYQNYTSDTAWQFRPAIFRPTSQILSLGSQHDSNPNPSYGFEVKFSPWNERPPLKMRQLPPTTLPILPSPKSPCDHVKAGPTKKKKPRRRTENTLIPAPRRAGPNKLLMDGRTPRWSLTPPPVRLSYQPFPFRLRCESISTGNFSTGETRR